MFTCYFMYRKKNKSSWAKYDQIWGLPAAFQDLVKTYQTVADKILFQSLELNFSRKIIKCKKLQYYSGFHFFFTHPVFVTKINFTCSVYSYKAEC